MDLASAIVEQLPWWEGKWDEHLPLWAVGEDLREKQFISRC